MPGISDIKYPASDIALKIILKILIFEINPVTGARLIAVEIELKKPNGRMSTIKMMIWTTIIPRRMPNTTPSSLSIPLTTQFLCALTTSSESKNSATLNRIYNIIILIKTVI